MKHARINSFEGKGIAEVRHEGGEVVCKGIFIADSAADLMGIYNASSVTFEGVLVEDGLEKPHKFSIYLTKKTYMDKSDLTIPFQAINYPIEG